MYFKNIVVWNWTLLWLQVGWLRLQVEVALNAARMATWHETVRTRTVAVEAAAVSGVFAVITGA